MTSKSKRQKFCDVSVLVPCEMFDDLATAANARHEPWVQVYECLEQQVRRGAIMLAEETIRAYIDGAPEPVESRALAARVQEGLVPCELIVMASLGCSPAEAVQELVRLEPALINLCQGHLEAVAAGVVTASTLNVREEPSTRAATIAKLAEGAAVQVWGRSPDGRWLAIDGPAGWVSAEWVALR